MKQAHDWVTTNGGPHLLIAEELLGYWRGVEGWRDNQDPTDQSDYARACRVTNWLGLITCNDGIAVVLSGDAGDIAWYPSGTEDGYLVQWIGVDDERLIEPAIQSRQMQTLFDGPTAEQLEFDTGASGAMRLIDASERGNDLQGDNKVLALKPGSYQARAAYYESDGLMLVVRQISRR